MYVALYYCSTFHRANLRMCLGSLWIVATWIRFCETQCIFYNSLQWIAFARIVSIVLGPAHHWIQMMSFQVRPRDLVGWILGWWRSLRLNRGHSCRPSPFSPHKKQQGNRRDRFFAFSPLPFSLAARRQKGVKDKNSECERNRRVWQLQDEWPVNLILLFA